MGHVNMSASLALAQLHATGVRVQLRADGMIELRAAAPPKPTVLAMARKHRDGIAALLRDGDAVPAPASKPDVPVTWCEGVDLLQTMSAPTGLLRDRWRAFQADAHRLLYQRGAELHRACWDALDLFGIHRAVPTARADCMGLAMLLNGFRTGAITPETVQLVGLDGHTSRAWRMGQQARRVAVAAWVTSTSADAPHRDELTTRKS